MLRALGRILRGLIAFVLVVGAAGVGWTVAERGIDPLQVAGHTLDGFFVKRTQVQSPPLSHSEGQPAIEYAILWGQEDADLFANIKEGVLQFQEFDPENPLTWVNVDVEVGSDSQAKKVSTMLRQILCDNPCYSVQYPATPIGASLDSSCVVTTAGTRFMAQSLYFPPTTEESVQRYGEVVTRVGQLHQQAVDECDGSQYDYIAKAFSLLASNMVYSYAGDEGPWYANNIYGALLGQESECMGMSCALKALLDCEGIPSFVATGNAVDTANGHAWVCIYLDDAWYACDLTRCVGDVVRTDQWGNKTTQQWKVGDVPDLSPGVKSALAGFMIPQDEYLSASKKADFAGTIYSFGGGILMDDDCYRVEQLYEKLLSM